jgi:hypothetical protein
MGDLVQAGDDQESDADHPLEGRPLAVALTPRRGIGAVEALAPKDLHPMERPGFVDRQKLLRWAGSVAARDPTPAASTTSRDVCMLLDLLLAVAE